MLKSVRTRLKTSDFCIGICYMLATHTVPECQKAQFCVPHAIHLTYLKSEALLVIRLLTSC